MFVSSFVCVCVRRVSEQAYACCTAIWPVCVCMCERMGVHVSYGHAFETQAVRDTAKRELKDSLCS